MENSRGDETLHVSHCDGEKIFLSDLQKDVLRASWRKARLGSSLLLSRARACQAIRRHLARFDEGSPRYKLTSMHRQRALQFLRLGSTSCGRSAHDEVVSRKGDLFLATNACHTSLRYACPEMSASVSKIASTRFERCRAFDV